MAVKLRLQRHGKKRKTLLPITADANIKKEMVNTQKNRKPQSKKPSNYRRC
jgi:hypothetical protein